MGQLLSLFPSRAYDKALRFISSKEDYRDRTSKTVYTRATASGAADRPTLRPLDIGDMGYQAIIVFKSLNVSLSQKTYRISTFDQKEPESQTETQKELIHPQEYLRHSSVDRVSKGTHQDLQLIA
ncbi:hypothetical protein Btru_027234 [Bulinus truncatus]|nr:hypothetical protein Btru_027234 [Bulinus truncatus]